MTISRFTLQDIAKVDSCGRLDEYEFLCKQGSTIFVSDVRFLVRDECDSTMPPNSDDGCYYVDHVRGRICVPINELDEIYLIQ